LNGVLIGSSSIGSNPAILSTFTIGSNYDGSNVANSIIYDMRFSTTLRTAPTLLAQYTNKTELIPDSTTVYRMNFNDTVASDINIAHQTKLILASHPGRLLIFNGGLLINPMKVIKVSIAAYHVYFRERDIIASDITIVDVGKQLNPYYTGFRMPATSTRKIGSSALLKDPTNILAFQTRTDTSAIVSIGDHNSMITRSSDGYIYIGGTATDIVQKLNPIDLSLVTARIASTSGTTFCMAIGSNGRLYIGSNDGTITSMDADTLVDILKSADFGTAITLMSPSTDGYIYMVGGGSPLTAKRINCSTLLSEATSASYTGGVTAMAVGPNGKVYIAGAGAQTVRKLNASTLVTETTSVSYGGNITAMVAHSNGSIYIGGYTRNTIIKLNATTLAVEAESPSFGAAITKIIVGSDSALYVCGAVQGNGSNIIKKYSPTTLELLATSPDFGSTILAITATSPDSTIVAAGGNAIPVMKYLQSSLQNATLPHFSQIDNVTYTLNENVAEVTIPATPENTNVHICTQNYNKVISKPYSSSGIIEVPTWFSFISDERYHLFVDGRLINPNRISMFNPFKNNITGEKTALVLDLDTNIETGESLTVFASSKFIRLNYHMTLVDGQKIVELDDTTYPFSELYTLIFVDGKLIPLTDIKLIDNYRFSIRCNSINELCILRREIETDYSAELDSQLDTWSTILAPLSTAQIEAIIGTLKYMNDTENNTRTPYLTERNMYELLYWYVLRNRRGLTLLDDYNIRTELSTTLLADDRIPISTVRDNSLPRYSL